MTVLEFLQNRASMPARLLSEPAPTKYELENIIKAALAAPDHGVLRPWKFIIIKGDSRKKLGDIFAKAIQVREPSLPNEKIERQRQKPLRSPIIITVVCKVTENHPKTPVIEQILSAGAAAQQILLAANTMGFGSIWLTGANASDPNVKQALDIADKDQIIGFLYIGTPRIKTPKMRRPEPSEYIEYL